MRHGGALQSAPNWVLARARGRLAPVLLAFVLALGIPPVAGAAVMPSGFTASEVVSGLASPTAMSLAPDGRLFVSEQAGRLRVVKNGALLATPFLTLDVDTEGERGLLGVAFDPGFSVNGFVYAFYTATTPVIHNRVSRFTASGDLVVPGSEVALLDLDPLGPIVHNGGAIHFGPDGTLYVAVGDNSQPSSAQSLDNRFGKILRINSDGTIPTDNPFFTAATGVNRSIWALGLRNPFSFALQPGTGRMFINDVGASAWEEVDVGQAGGNYGWPDSEGPTADPRFISPIFSYQHGTTGTTGCAITGGALYNPATATLPAPYAGAYFFADYCNGWIRRLDPAAPAVASGFSTAMGSVIDLDAADDGTLYALTRSSGDGKITAIRYGAGWDPGITSQPLDQIVAVGESVGFTAAASGTAPLVHQWQRDGVDIPGATAATYTLGSTTLSDDGARFTVRVTNAVGTVTSREASLRVIGGARPIPLIDLPAAGASYDAGDVMDYAGSGTDTDDGELPGTAFTWRVDFHHADHVHPFLPSTSGARAGSFAIPNRGESSTDVFYRILLTVRDSDGLTQTVFRDVHPNTVTFTLATKPNGLHLTLDGQPVVTPYSTTGVVGLLRQVGASTPQSASGESWVFRSWSDRGSAVHDIVTPGGATSYTATYVPADGTVPTCRGRAATVIGDGPITGTSGPDVVVGSPVPDTITGLAGDDVICGVGAADRLLPGPGDDIVDGGTGVDTVSYENATNDVVVSLVRGTASGEGSDTLSALEHIVGSVFNDRLDGSAGANRIWGGPGADVLQGSGGNDRLFGQGGNDTLDGGVGTDVCQQGTGTGSVAACELS